MEMEVTWLSIPAQNSQAAVEPKIYRALGQATRGNSKLEETELLLKA